MTVVAFWTAVGAWVLLEASLMLRDVAGGFDRRRAADHNSGPILVVSIAIGIAVDVALSGAPAGQPALLRDGGLVAAGIACMWAGLLLRLWAVLTLGRFFRLVVLVQEGHHVVDRGPYRLLRHPSYAGTMLTLLGLGLALRSWPGCAAAVLIPLIGYAPRIIVEERALRESLGDAYVRYARRTRRLVPFLW
ncbi:MAG: methyltransferase family protein [Candidatus Dormibacteria bacterium]